MDAGALHERETSPAVVFRDALRPVGADAPTNGSTETTEPSPYPATVSAETRNQTRCPGTRPLIVAVTDVIPVFGVITDQFVPSVDFSTR